MNTESILKSLGPVGAPSGLLDLLTYIKSYCHDHGISVLLGDKNDVDSGDGVGCSGYFEATEKVLAVAVGKSVHRWLPILMHEFCHAKQYMEDPKWFLRCSTSESLLFEWAYGKREMKRPTMMKHLKLCIEIERDCEDRAVALIKKFKIASVVPVADYARKANAYLYFWRYFADTRQWYERGNPPYEQKELCGLMPSEIQKSYMRMPKAVRQAFHEAMARGTR